MFFKKSSSKSSPDASASPAAPQIEYGRHLVDVYDALAGLPAGLLLDVGAAVGGTTRKMRRRSPKSRVIAFEPNPANWPHFEAQHGNDELVTLRRAAVAEKPGVLKFAARHAIDAEEGNWSKYRGASSVGQVQEDGDVEVEAVTLDDTLGGDTAIFCKVDVQGYEPKVLQGAQRALKERRIKVLLIEFMAYAEIFPLLSGYRCFSQEWSVIPRLSKKLPPPDFSSWDLGPVRQLSTGKSAYKSWPRQHPASADEFMAFQLAENAKIGRCWTDLLFVAPDFVDTYVAAAAVQGSGKE